MKQSKFIFLLILLITQSFADATDACDDSGSHSDEWWFIPDLSWFEIVVGILIIIGSIIGILPQIIKILKLRNSKGLAPEFVLFVSLNTTCAFTNSTILNFPYMESCPYVGYDVCFSALLTWGQFFSLIIISNEIVAK